MKSKRILFKIWKFPILSETFILAQIITAINNGYDVRILVEELMDLKKSTHEYLIDKYKILDKIIFEDYNIPENKFKRILNAFYLILINFNKLTQLIKYLSFQKKLELKYIYIFHFYSNLEDFDIVHVQYGTNGKPLDLLKKANAFSPKMLISFHGHDVYFPINGIIPNNGYYDDLFKESNLLIANTPYLRDVLIRLGAQENKIKIVPVAVDTEFFKKSDRLVENDMFEIITVGRLEVFKGQILGLQCIKELRDKGYPVNYTVVGTGSQDQKLMDYVSQNDLNRCVTFTGRKSQFEIRELLQNKDLFLMTSITDPEYGVESQGLVTAEAQACGVPVIGFDSGGVKYTIANKETGYIVEEGNVSEMVNKIEYLIRNKEHLQKMKQNTISYIHENFSGKVLNREWKNIYDSL